MNLGFWEKLKKPIIVLAPMADVTDAVFRQLIAKYSRPDGPDVFWTEFVSADGLCHPKARPKLLVDLLYTNTERPIVAQLFTSNPDKMREASKLVAELGFDGLDINMGCPDRSVEKQGAGASLMKNPKLAREIIRSAKEGITLAGRNIPVSVKTRLGYNKDELETWLPELLKEDLAVVTIHARTRKEMSKVPARWDRVKRAVEIRNECKSNTLIFGNGDVLDVSDAKIKATETGADGIMLGRAIFGTPWLFSNSPRSDLKSSKRSDLVELESTTSEIKRILSIALEHTILFEKKFAGIKNFSTMKKHYKAYITGFDGASELRARLMETENAKQVEDILNHYL